MKAREAEIELAGEMLVDAELMCKEGRLKSTLNRAYYAMFHAVKAVLLLYGKDCQSHAGALNRFGEGVIKIGIMDEKFAKSLHRAYRLREKSDYSPMFKIEENEVKKVLKEAKEFVVEARNYGSWGGNNWSGGKIIKKGEIGDTNVSRKDSLDELYKIHDIESYNNYSEANNNLAEALRNLPDDTSKWSRFPENVWYAKIHKMLATLWFKVEKVKTGVAIKKICSKKN